MRQIVVWGAEFVWLTVSVLSRDNLSFWVYGMMAGDSATTKPLTWKQRLEIALNAAQGDPKSVAGLKKSFSGFLPFESVLGFVTSLPPLPAAVAEL